MIRNRRVADRLRTGALAAAAVTLVSLIVAYPSQAFGASLAGLTVWWEYVFPALLPFFILSELLLGFGVVHAAGAFLSPAMRALFRLPGAGGWALAVSFAAGFPSGAKAAADLRREGAVTRAEGDRLLAVSHLCSPIFLVSVVAVGFAGRPDIGLPLAAIHLVSALAAGALLSRLPFGTEAAGAPPGDEPERPGPADAPRGGFARSAASLASAMADAHRKDGRPLGRLLGDAVTGSVQALLAIGGLMIVFSVLLQLLSAVGVAGALRAGIQTAFVPLGMPAALAEGAFAGLFEVHLGAYALLSGGELTVWSAALVSAAVAWGGLSVHAQVGSFLAGTDLRYAPFLIGRLAHAALAALVAFALWRPLLRWFGGDAPAFAPGAAVGAAPAPTPIGDALPYLLSSLQALGVFLAALAFLAAAVRLWRRAAPAVRR
ncbi:nucleoside recognition domain-containing protein [Paenibacillus sp.]|uniref:nucleoside recognition domain-containing protein n=1 Tax=Paenibacillus sp. TaxID=58172 RepID=UPI002D5B21BE|nr:nucleoside recognition domain-containing protein [Paenibacillus sp.]HZG55341.1 nucleoside recognition domain-containing protein [Paenibacillus sp.]